MRRFLTLLVAFVVFGASSALAQTKLVSGKVVGSDDNLPIPGVSVFVKGSPTIGVMTDIDGNYNLKTVPANAKVLVFRFVGYQTVEMPITGATINVTLASENQKMDEVVVVAYGTVKKSSMTSSASQVGGKELSTRPVSDAMKALEGQAAGIQVTPGYGAPGSAPTIRVRGVGSINGSNDPLYVVDGIPYESSNGGISDINSSDIENISVLKDAAATSLYGSRAANGVVMVTTKKGKTDQFTVTAKASFGVSTRGISEYERIGALDYYPTIWKAIRNGNSYGSTAYTGSKTWIAGTLPATGTGSMATATTFANTNLIGTYLKYNILTTDGKTQMDPSQIVDADGVINPNASVLSGYTDLDWFKELTRLGKRKEYSVSASGGTAKSDYFFSIGYLDENGYILKSDMERITARSTINVRPTTWLKLGANIAGTVNNSNTISGDVDYNSSYTNPFFFARNIGPIYPVYLHNPVTGLLQLDENGGQQWDLEQNVNRGSGASSGRHVLAELLLNSKVNKSNTLDAKSNAEFTLPYGFKTIINGGYYTQDIAISKYENPIVGDSYGAGRLKKTQKKYTTTTLNELLTWNKSFNVHNVDVLLGHEYSNRIINEMYGVKQQQAASGIKEFPNFTILSDLGSQEDRDKIESYFSRINYNYAEKYFVSGSFRRDGSSRFAEDVRWGNFFSASLAWNVTREEFIRQFSWINELKVRASYGETGNNNLLDEKSNTLYYPYQNLYDLGYNNGMNSTGGVIQNKILANQNVSWEKNKQSNIAVDFKFRNRFSGSVELFNRVSDNLLFNVPLALSAGFIATPQNIGSMYNRGIELSLTANVLNMRGLNWDVSVNATSLKNRITKMPQETPAIVLGTKQLSVGHSIYDFWLRQYAGVDARDGSSLYLFDPKSTSAAFPTTENYTFRTLNGVQYTTNPNYALYAYSGSAVPDVYGGITNKFDYKGFSLSVLLAYSVGGKAYDAAYASLMSYGAGSSLSPDILNAWQKPGDITDVPRIDNTKNAQLNAGSSRWLVKSDYIALKNVTLGYTVNSKYLAKANIKSLNAFFAADNLGMLCARKGFNPQTNFGGTTNNTYVMSRIFTFGVNLTL
jgi:TonB-linked SusC/RagA family outer membrane protein